MLSDDPIAVLATQQDWYIDKESGEISSPEFPGLRLQDIDLDDFGHGLMQIIRAAYDAGARYGR